MGASPRLGGGSPDCGSAARVAIIGRMSGVRLIALLTAALAFAAAGSGLGLLVGEGIDVGDPVVGVVETAITAGLLALLLRWQRPENRTGTFLMLAAILFGLSALAAGILASSAGPPLAREAAFAWIWLGQAPLILTWVVLILALPDGEVRGGLRRGFLVAASFLAGAVAVAGYLLAAPCQIPAFPPAIAP